jgi:hypothetical protein
LREYSPTLAKAADRCFLLINHDIHSRGAVDRAFLMIEALLAPIFPTRGGLVREIDLRE